MSYNYPELYYRIYPKVIDSINRYLEKNEYRNDISKEDIESIIDEVHEKMIHECPEISQDSIERKGRYRITRRPFYGRGRLIRDIISIILISELIRRTNPYGFY